MDIRLLVKAAASSVAALLCACASPAVAVAAPVPMTFGVLAAACTSQRLGAERAAGITAVELPLAWDRYEPQAGRVDRTYVAEVRQKIAACRAAGMRVMLGSGVQYAPDWVRALPGALLRGSAGGTPVHGGLDLVFNAAVRTAVHDYFGRLAQDLPLRDVAGMRIGVSGTGELAFPGPGDATATDSDGREYWAFGAAPQTGAGLAVGAAVTPMPGWVPGQGTWRGAAVSSQQADAWLGWYAGSLLDTVVWQVGRLRELGYTGDVHIPVAGRGILPADRATAVRGLLDGRADPDGALERGLDYPRQFPVLAGLSGIVLDYTGLDDISAVLARRSRTPQDRCLPGDTDRLLERTDTADWPGQRFTTALARRVGLRLAGENPGPPGSPYTGGQAASDTSAQQMQRAPDYARDCGMTEFYWAFEDDLFTPGSGVTVGTYAARIQAYRAGVVYR